MCGVKYSGCVLRSSRVLFESLLYRRAFFFTFMRQESGIKGKAEKFMKQTSTYEFIGYEVVCFGVIWIYSMK